MTRDMDAHGGSPLLIVREGDVPPSGWRSLGSAIAQRGGGKRLVLEGGSDADAWDWTRYGPKDRRALAGSLIVHASVLAAFLFSLQTPIPIKRPNETINSFNVSFVPGDGAKASIPKTATEHPQKKVEKPVAKPVEQPKPLPDTAGPEKQQDPQPQPPQQQPARDQQDSPAQANSDSAADASKPGGGAMIWTPPAPKPNAAGISSSGKAEEQRVEMPVVDLPKGASDPVLLSYDQVRFTDAAAVSEATRLMNTGTITMAVTVDDKGVVGECAVTVSSGSRMLDERACLLVKSYLYRPAQDARGKPHGAIVTEVLEWARDGKFTVPADASSPALQSVRSAESAMPKTAPAMPRVQMPNR